MFREAGLTDIDVEVSVRVHPLGHSRRPIFRDFINTVRDKLIDGGFISRDELEQNLRAYERHLADPDVLATSNPYFLVRGRVPTGR